MATPALDYRSMLRYSQPYDNVDYAASAYQPIAASAATPMSAGAPSFNYNLPNGQILNDTTGNISSYGTPTTGTGWQTASNAMGAIQGGLGVIEGFKDLFGHSDADKQRKFAKTFTMREWNTKARMYDNELQMMRNKINMYNATYGTNLTTADGLKSLGTWGSKPGRVLGSGDAYPDATALAATNNPGTPLSAGEQQRFAAPPRRLPTNNTGKI